ncbi:DUF2877 domain-containing protein [Cedecea colo]|uniref:DUF2877 domain-containing protein n=1 Tax=Cedecea colo TaxID=2552946 RepID=A0ABX0VKM7_9ENTR|nr:DUF2877 domain-containing protein [Cedecea colo]NIY47607.1 DUF2877 domain-containing protein [Cedecea colo]
MNTVLALAGCALPFTNGCLLRLHSRFIHAINFIDEHDVLFTLHRYGKGCSPFGWVIRERDFASLRDITSLQVEHGKLHGAKLNIGNRRQITFAAPVGALPPLDVRTFTQMTGLLGPLNQIAEGMTFPVLERVICGLSKWSAGDTPDWSNLIGLGPGLTPSGDDMLCGALAALYCHPRYRNKLRQHLFLPTYRQVMTLTTLVSCSYLDNAARGQFSTQVLRLLYALNKGQCVLPAARALLNHGHTSGADTLLGFVTAQEWLEDNA